MRGIAFYLLFYFYPIAKIIFAVVRRIFAFLSMMTLIAAFYYNFSVPHLLATAVFLRGRLAH